jgi:16S rRNA (adenine1518-N6/adenine1519-N6)-dimethyltransferase
MDAFREAPLTPGSVRRVLAGLGVRPSKRRGQSFLVSRRAAARIAAAADLGKSDAVLEIGPGLGALTAELLRRAGCVIAIESDRRLAGWLKDCFRESNQFELIHGDALAIDIAGLVGRLRARGGSVKVVSNIPYSISGPLIGRLLDGAAGVSLFVLTIQDELARRIIAPPGGKEYGPFSVFCRYHAEPVKLFAVPPSAFYPRPAVVSAVVAFWPRQAPPFDEGDREAFFALVKLLFSQRRKTVGALLRGALRDSPAASRLTAIFSASGIEPRLRAEGLGLKEFASLSGALMRIGGVRLDRAKGARDARGDMSP